MDLQSISTVNVIWGPNGPRDAVLGWTLKTRYVGSDHLSWSPICLSLSCFKALLSQLPALSSFLQVFLFTGFYYAKVTHDCNVFREQYLGVRGKWTHLTVKNYVHIWQAHAQFVWYKTTTDLLITVFASQVIPWSSVHDHVNSPLKPTIPHKLWFLWLVY